MIALLGRKSGMTQIFGDNGELVPVTVIELQANRILAKRSKEKDGYSALVVGLGEKKKSRVTKPLAKQFGEVSPAKVVREFRDYEGDLEAGSTIDLSSFDKVRYVDVIATSKGKGFQGVVKRWGFGGGRKTHGSKFHREPGSTGQSTFPHHSFKNIKLPGRMGGERVTVQNLRVISLDKEKSILMVKGAVPGPKTCTLMVCKAKKRR